MDNVLFFTGMGNEDLGDSMMVRLREYAGQRKVHLGPIRFHPFTDGESDDAYPEWENIAGKTVVFFECLKDAHTTFRYLQLCYALKHQYGAKHLIAVVSFLHFRRQDNEDNMGEIRRLEWMIRELKHNGVDELILPTPHSGAIARYCEKYDIKFWAIDVSEIFVGPLKTYIFELKDSRTRVKLYAPDEGSILRAIALARLLNVGVLFNLKNRGFSNDPEIIEAVQEEIDRIKRQYPDVELEYATPELVKDAIIIEVEDELDTARTLNGQALRLKDNGAREIFACITHPVCSPGWLRKFLYKHPFSGVIMCDTIHRTKENKTGGRMYDVSVADLLASEVFKALQKFNASS
jgi:ribose-phosphate pyrophosphokinase